MASAEVIDGNDAEHRHERSPDQGDQVGEGHVGPPAVIMAQEEEDEEFDRHDPGQPGPELRRLVAGQGQHEVESQQHRQPEHQGENAPGAPPPPPRSAAAASRWACCCRQPPQPRRHGAAACGQPGPPHRSPACGIPALDRPRQQSASSVSRSMACENHLPAPRGLSPALDWLSHV